ncbi:MAG TPA: glycoside hydrolase family 3 N-terminal domain-containing protein [Rhizomicrobium sp.]|nr:glycoside hydrolase family 3 N-terminal domain-containing protein [Rhizomicrobium sp.]
MTRIERLLAQMTLAEKLGQMTMTTSDSAVTGPVMSPLSQAAIRSGETGNLLNLFGPEKARRIQKIAVEESRLGIPLLLAFDVIHGHRTIFPIPLAEAGLFDPVAWEMTAREAALDAAADGINMTFAPMLDVARDPRWGRITEGPGESAFVGAAIARAKTRGFQTARLSDGIAACAKHYCAYGAVTAGREYAPTDLSDLTLRQVYLPPFAAAVEAGVASVMPAFTDLNGVPMTAHAGLLRQTLRGEMGFDGVIVSDYTAIVELINHGVASDLAEAAALALKAGVDIDMMSGAYARGLPEALERGLARMDDIDAAVTRVLTLKERLGLFDNPYRGGGEDRETLARRRALARNVAARSLVLLKNERNALPLSRGRLAVIGPLAVAASDMRGSWPGAGPPDDPVTVLAGLRAAWTGEIVTAPGTGITGDDTSGIAAAAALCDQADMILLCLGEAAAMSGEAASRVHLGLPGRQQMLADAVFDRAGGKPVIVILFSGRPLAVPELVERADAVIAAWFPGSEAGNALADILTGARSPSGRTAVTWPRAVGQIPIFHDQRPGGRPFNAKDHYTSKYLDAPNTPLFPFGHGLTYGDFRLSGLRVSPADPAAGSALDIRVDVVNRGRWTAEETLFLFTRQKRADVTTPVLELKGFGKIALEAGASGVLTLPLPQGLNPGPADIFVGPSADPAGLISQTILVHEA